MGCDIHGWVEKKHNGKWIAVSELKDRSRIYRRFALLAGVRDYNNEGQRKALGVPHDVSDTAGYAIEREGTDGHSHGFMALTNAGEIFLKTEDDPTPYEREYPLSAFFGYEDENADNARLVFWFDN